MRKPRLPSRNLVAVLVLTGFILIALGASRGGEPSQDSLDLPPSEISRASSGPATAPDDAVISNARLELHAGVSGDRIGALTIVDRTTGRTAGANLGQQIVFPGLVTYRLPGDVQLTSPAQTALDVPTLLGPGQELHLAFASLDGALLIDLYVLLPNSGDTFFLQSAVRSTTEDLPPDRILYFKMPSLDRGVFDAGESSIVLSDATTVIRHDFYSDGTSDDLIGLGSPVYVAGPGGRAIVMAWLDEPSQWPMFSLERQAPDLRLGFETGPLGRLADRAVYVDEEGAAWSPRLLFDIADLDTRVAFEDYKRVIAALHPEPPLPDWFGPQWDSYWVYDLDINEYNTLANASAIDTYFSDLGPWSIIFDAGWYLDGGRPGSAPDVLNYAKFPNGLAPVIAYLKERGMRSILYFSSPYIDTRESVDAAGFAGPPPWMALPGFVERYPDLVRSLSLESQGPSYVYDYLQPGMQEYLRYLMQLYLVEFGGDGILLDLVGEAGPSIADFSEDDRAPGGRVPVVARQSLEVYRSVWEAATAAKPDALVEGSWFDPPLSRSFAQTWRYGDEVEQFNYYYPYNGLVQKVDYAILQRQMLGMRPHMGYLRGPGTAAQLQQDWMGAAIALGAQFAISVDFSQMTAEAAETYRSFLAHYKPFTGFTFFGPGGIAPGWFATTRDGVTYLGVVNRDDRAVQVRIPLAELGLANGRQVIAYEPGMDDARFVNGDLAIDIEGQTFRFIVLRDTPGAVWGSRKTRESTDGTVLTIDVDPSPLATGGRVMVFAPASALHVDAPGFSIDTDEAQFQRVSFDTGEPAQIRVTPIQRTP